MAAPKTEAELEEMLKDSAIAEQIRDSADKWASEGFERAKGRVQDDLKIKRIPLKGHNPYAKGAALDGEWESFGAYLRDAFNADMLQKVSPAIAKASLAEGGGETGGFLVPEEFRAQLFELAMEAAIVRPRAFVMPMGASSVRIPTIKETSRASSVYGGVTANWSAEASTLTESEPTFGQMELTARKLTGYTVAGNELLADSAVALEALLMRLFGNAITFYEEEAFVNGTGAGQPLGIVTSSAKVSVGKENNQTATTIVYENINKMYSRMLPSSRDRAVWLAHIDTFPELATMALDVGTGGGPVWIQPGGAAGTPPMSIWGRPVIFTEHCQTLGTQGDIIFADLSYYVIGDRQQLQMAASSHVKFTTDESVWRFVSRLDGRPWMDAPLTPKHGSNDLSPFVVLDTRS